MILSWLHKLSRSLLRSLIYGMSLYSLKYEHSSSVFSIKFAASLYLFSMQKPLNCSIPVISMIICLIDLIVKVIFFFAKSKHLISLHMLLTISSLISAFCFTPEILSTRSALSSLIFLSSSRAYSLAYACWRMQDLISESKF